MMPRIKSTSPLINSQPHPLKLLRLTIAKINSKSPLTRNDTMNKTVKAPNVANACMGKGMAIHTIPTIIANTPTSNESHQCFTECCTSSINVFITNCFLSSTTFFLIRNRCSRNGLILPLPIRSNTKIDSISPHRIGHTIEPHRKDYFLLPFRPIKSGHEQKNTSLQHLLEKNLAHDTSC